MTSGGHARSGPPPDPNALRRDRPGDAATWKTLYPRVGDVPKWPLSRPAKRESDLWARLWGTPQASEWEALALHDEVAAYVRTFCEATVPDASPALRTLMLRQMEGIGLSATGLSRLRWRIATTEPVTEATKTHDRRRTSASARFQVIQGTSEATG
jgi:hypothetical protein